MNYLSTGRLPTDRHLSLIPQMEQQVSTNLYKRNVLFLKPEDVTTRNGEVFTPNLMTLSKLRRSEQFKKDVVFSDNMSGNDVRCRLEEVFPELINIKRFSCAARENKDSSRLVFHGDRRVWDGITMRRKLRGASAMYIVLEDEISQVPASTVTSGGTTGAAVSGNNNYRYNPLDTATVTDAFPPDLKDVNPGRFEMDWKDVMDVLEEDIKKSEQVDSRRSETGLHITPRFAVIQEHNKLYQVPSAAAQGSKRYDPGYVSSADSSSQDQELYQGTVVTNDNNRKRSEGPAAASRTSQRRQTSFSSEEGSSSQDKELDREAAAAIFPKSGPVKGGTLFSLHNLQVDGSVTYLLATFGAKQVGITPEPDGGNSWLGRTPPGEKPGEVTVAVVSKETGAYLGETIFTYEPEDEKKTENKQSVSSKRELENYSSLDLLDELTRRIKKAKQDCYSEENGISNHSQQQGMPNRAKLLQLQDIVKSLVYVAAETGARELIEELCSLSAGKIAFEAYKNECPLPENIAEDNGHKEIAAFLKGITKRYSEEDSTNPGQPEDVDWLVLAKAFEDINLIQSDPSADQDLRLIPEDNISETGYSGDGETSSSNSERDSCDSDDEYEVCKGNPVSVVPEEDEVLLESLILHFEADSSCSSLLELQRTTSVDEELMVHTRKAVHFSAGETKNDSRYLGSAADFYSEHNNSVEEKKEGETQHGNESYLEGESCCTGTDKLSCDLLELPGSDLEEKMQRTSHQGIWPLCPEIHFIEILNRPGYGIQSQENNQADWSRKVKVAILASEWGSSKGGLSTINRELAIQLAKCPEVEITFFLPNCSEEDKNIALRHKIEIVEATRRPGFEELELLSFPPENLQIDVIVGHGVKLGHQAQVIRDSKKSRWIQIVHTDPEELRMLKNYLDPISKGEEKHKTEVELCEMADLVVGVGPKSSEAFRSYLRGCQNDPTVLDFTPGVFDEFVSVKQVPNESKTCSILMFGHGDVEDFEVKGFDIAGKAVATLPNTRLVFVGAPDGKHEEIKQRFTECGILARCLRVTRHTDPGAKPKKTKSGEEVTAPTTSNDGKSDEVCLNFTGQKSKLGLKSLLRRKESGKNQCSGVSYTPRRDCQIL